MKLRTVLHVTIGTLVAVTLVFLCSSLQARQDGLGSRLADMVSAQKHAPLLWVIDVCAAVLILGMWWFAVVTNHVQGFIDHQTQQHTGQLTDMIERTLEMEQLNDAYAEQIERLEAEVSRRFNDLSEQMSKMESLGDTRREAFEMEMRRIAENSQHRLQSQVDSNTDQMEAVSASLQFHRSELRRLRLHIHELQAAVPRAIPPSSAISSTSHTSTPACAQHAQTSEPTHDDYRLPPSAGSESAGPVLASRFAENAVADTCPDCGALEANLSAASPAAPQI